MSVTPSILGIGCVPTQEENLPAYIPKWNKILVDVFKTQLQRQFPFAVFHLEKAAIENTVYCSVAVFYDATNPMDHQQALDIKHNLPKRWDAEAICILQNQGYPYLDEF